MCSFFTQCKPVQVHTYIRILFYVENMYVCQCRVYRAATILMPSYQRLQAKFDLSGHQLTSIKALKCETAPQPSLLRALFGEAKRMLYSTHTHIPLPRLVCAVLLYADGYKFYRSANNVILCLGNKDGFLSTQYFERVEEYPSGKQLSWCYTAILQWLLSSSRFCTLMVHKTKGPHTHIF